MGIPRNSRPRANWYIAYRLLVTEVIITRRLHARFVRQLANHRYRGVCPHTAHLPILVPTSTYLPITGRNYQIITDVFCRILSKGVENSINNTPSTVANVNHSCIHVSLGFRRQ